MRERPVVRLALIGLLLAVCGVQLADYATHEDEKRVYPTGTELDDDFERYHGERVDVWLTVDRRTEDGFRATNGWAVTAESLPSALDPGDEVQVYGTARPGPAVDAERVVVTDARNRTYMLAASALALLLVGGYSLRHWQPEPMSGYFRPRNQHPGEGDG
ncbi:hypothetical protein [Halorientalis salina]|uniref:hypothetical protein n=1 Tax=Halorientalis salina TaxID=2932266 RepID=UPI0010AB5B0F|nr:hypothetical protein [Halorientalis salina]